MAKLTPRTRKAGMPTKIPNTVATNAAKNGEMGKGIPTRSVIRESVKPATPAIAICASEI